MSILTNKHFVIALIVAPILAVISYFAVDAAVSEKPHSAISGKSYELVEQSNCRYNSGRCVLKNGNFSLELKADWLEKGRLKLSLQSEHPLDGIKIVSTKASNVEAVPESMEKMDALGQQWQLVVNALTPQQDKLRLVASADDAFYFAEASLAFTLYETAFEQDFR